MKEPDLPDPLLTQDGLQIRKEELYMNSKFGRFLLREARQVSLRPIFKDLIIMDSTKAVEDSSEIMHESHICDSGISEDWEVIYKNKEPRMLVNSSKKELFRQKYLPEDDNPNTVPPNYKNSSNMPEKPNESKIKKTSF